MVVSVIDLEKKLRLTVRSLESGKFLLEQLNNIRKKGSDAVPCTPIRSRRSLFHWR